MDDNRSLTPEPEDMFMTQRGIPDDQEEPFFQDLLNSKQQYHDDGLESIGNTTILLRNPAETDSATPEYFFEQDGSAMVGTAYRSYCDVKLPEMMEHKMSNKALQFTLATGQLQVTCINRFNPRFQIVEPTGIKQFLAKNSTHTVYSIIGQEYRTVRSTEHPLGDAPTK